MRLRAFFTLALIGVWTGGAIGCTSFAAVRSAEVLPGPSGAVQLSVALPPRDAPRAFWSFDCANECDYVLPSYDLGLFYGLAWTPPVEVGLGINGIDPYLQGFLQLGGLADGKPWGLGGRLGFPGTTLHDNRVFARYDVELNGHTRILLNPVLYYFTFTGNSPNGENRRSFLWLEQGVGLELRGERASLIPAASVIVGRGIKVFGTAAVSLILHRRPRRGPG